MGDAAAATPPGRKSAAAAPASGSGSGGAAKFLSGLPSSGNFSAPVISSNLGGMRVYVCDHDTSPPEGQIIKTDQTNILIRSLQLNRTKHAERSGSKRSARGNLDSKTPSKKPHVTAGEEGASSSISSETLMTMTVERLRAHLKQRGLSPRGKKDELIARLREHSS